MTDPLAGFRNNGNAQNAGQQMNSIGGIGKSDVQAGIDYVNQHGGDPKTACIELLKSQGKPIPSNPFVLAMQLLNAKR